MKLRYSALYIAMSLVLAPGAVLAADQDAAPQGAPSQNAAPPDKRVKQLDAIMRNVLRNDVGTLTAWIMASHVERVPHRRKPQKPPAPPAEPPKSEK